MTPPLVCAPNQCRRTSVESNPAHDAGSRIRLDRFQFDFADAVRPHIPQMIASARRILRSEDLAWDAVQEALQRLWVGGRLPENAAPVLIYWVKKASLHLRRCQARRSVHESVSASSSAGSCCEEDPLAILESSEKVRLIRDAILELSQEYRSVLELVEIGGDSYETIASRLDLPIGTVRSRLSRARQQLREKLGPHFFAA